MKLRNKLIPIMTIATASTVVAPIASSCSMSMENVVSDSKDITSPFTPTIAKADKMGTIASPVDPDKVMDIYMDHVMANPEILKQDIWYFESKMLPYRIEEIEHTYVDIYGDHYISEETKYNSVSNVVANINISDVEVKKQEGIIKAEKTEFYTISMNIGYELEYTATSLATDPRVQLDEKVSFQTQYKNVPLFMYNYEGEYYLQDRDYCWFYCDLTSPNIDEYLNEIDGGWSFGYDISEEYNYNITSSQGLTQNYGDKNSAKDTLNRRSQIEKLYKDTESFAFDFLYDGGHINFPSYHMSDVIPADVQVFKLVGNTENTAAKVTLTYDSGDWIATPAENSFHILQLTGRYESMWENDFTYLRLWNTGGLLNAKTNAEKGDKKEDHPIVSLEGPLFMESDNDYNIYELDIGYGQNDIVKSTTKNNFDVSTQDDSMSIYDSGFSGTTGSTFKVKFTIPSGLSYAVAYECQDKTGEYDWDTVYGYVYDDIDYWVEFTVA